MSHKGIDRRQFPHIDLDEVSSRLGVEGPRYVPAPGYSGRLGDTNTGLMVHPQMRQESSTQ